MRLVLWLAAALIALPDAAAASPPVCATQKAFAIAVHGGEITGKMDGAARLASMKEVLERARADLAAGRPSLDVVENAVRAMEDSGAFNAGKGAIADAAGLVETDAAIMDGQGLRAGSVASMTGLKNPVSAARLVMDQDRHVMMVGDRGQSYVVKLGAVTVPRSYFTYTGKVTRRAVKQHDTAPRPEHGTVGAVALDRCGHLAAATSTGGYDAKIPGRVGDAPVIGAGVYAADGTAAFSGTGFGEYYIRYNISKDAADRIAYQHQALDAAMRYEMMDVLKPLHADGGLIGVDAGGNVSLIYNNLGMFRGLATDEEAPVVAQYDGPTQSKPRSAK